MGEEDGARKILSYNLINIHVIVCALQHTEKAQQYLGFAGETEPR